jgi:hypothetical protein
VAFFGKAVVMVLALGAWPLGKIRAQKYVFGFNEFLVVHHFFGSAGDAQEVTTPRLAKMVSATITR